ncbi:ABC transporter B family member 11 [Dendrobium catenatum]|uniref:ABC transporter B family member 11 n=1 Tax=Dendrobium catenatum TaxID=906689 RepID=UPI0009F210AA|nr:ABC transporter B family member 11 [Dendrobium catenatum]
MEKLMRKMSSRIDDSPIEEDGVSHDLQNLIAPTSWNSISTKAEGNGSEIKQDARDGKKEDQETKVVPIYKLFSFSDSTDIILMTLGTAGALANGATMPLLTVIVGSLINTFGEDPDIDQVVHRVSKVCLNIVYLAIGAGFSSFFQVSCWMVTGERQAARIRNSYLKALLKQEIAFFDKEGNTGEIVSRISGDTVLIQDAMGEKVGKFIGLTSTFFTAFIIAFAQGWLLTLVMISVIPIIGLCSVIISKVTIKTASIGQNANAETSIIVQQTISSIRTVASFTGENLSVKNFEKTLKNAYKSSINEGIVAGFGSGILTFLSYCALSLGFWYGAKLILQRGYNGGKVISIIFSVLFGSSSLAQVSPCMAAFAAGQAAAYKMFETINRKPEIDATDSTGKTLDVIVGSIEFKDVHFSYPSRPEQKIFTGLSLFIQHGTTVALVGGSGSGKSTVISLIERFYDPQDGVVLIDGTNIKQFQLRWLREKIGLVSQEPILFGSTIGDNITYGKNNATIEEIKAATELANASKFINMMPQGLDTMVGEQGTQLSGGQKQRISIARAILKDPRILLLDEATSALDVESEQVVQEALDRVMINHTTVIIAHRLSTVRNADTIAVMHQGSIIEKGSHLELQKDPMGAYSQLIRLQEMDQNFNQSSQAQTVEVILPAIEVSSLSRKGSLKQSISRESSLRDVSGHLFFTEPALPVDLGSLKQSISRESSLRYVSGHLFFTEPALPVAINWQESPSGEPKEDIPSKKSIEESIRRLAHINKPEALILLFGSVAAFFNGVLYPAYAILLSTMIRTFYEAPHKLKKDSIFWSTMYLVFGAVGLVAIPIRSYLFAIAGAKLIRRIRLMTFQKVVNMEIAWFDQIENSSGAISARLSTDAVALRSLVGDALAVLVQNISTLVCGLAVAFVASWQLTLIILALVPIISLNGIVRMKFNKGFSANAEKMYEEASQVANDALGSMRTIASFSAEEKIMELYKKKCKGPIKAGIKQGILSGMAYGVSYLLVFCVYAAIFYAGSHLVGVGKITFDKVFQAFLAIAVATLEIAQSSSNRPDSNKAKLVMGSIFAILDRQSRIDPSDESGMILNMIEGNIEFRHVSFKYPSRPNVQIFRDICFAIQSGKTIAFVGESGSGKSTAIALLQRFYDPDSGHILLDGIELQKFQLSWLRKQMGLVSQEPMLFNNTIRFNIAYGKEDKASEDEIIVAAELANAHNFISSLNQGYETIVGERGIQISGGQKQRLAIARAIVKQPKVLLLDEATSALDSESERIVQTALEQIMVNRTTVVVAHRLTTIKSADLIAVIKDGMIVEQGKHDALLNIKDGVYASLVAIHSTTSS